jgi:hypothetical protein
MNERTWTILAILCGTAIAAGIIISRQTHPTPAAAPRISPLANTPSQTSSSVPDSFAAAPPVVSNTTPQSPPRPSIVRSIPTGSESAAASATPKLQKKSRHNGTGAPQPPPTLVAPQARIALALVGSDPTAESVWLGAINDPFVPPNERKNLIEDLNEDGFADPHHISPDEMPLVMSRIQLIEQLAPFSTDDTNTAAFNEAYKDLTNMLSDPNPK